MGAFGESMSVTVVWRGRRYVSSEPAQARPVPSMSMALRHVYSQLCNVCFFQEYSEFAI